MTTRGNPLDLSRSNDSISMPRSQSSFSLSPPSGRAAFLSAEPVARLSGCAHRPRPIMGDVGARVGRYDTNANGCQAAVCASPTIAPFSLLVATLALYVTMSKSGSAICAESRHAPLRPPPRPSFGRLRLPCPLPPPPQRGLDAPDELCMRRLSRAQRPQQHRLQTQPLRAQ